MDLSQCSSFALAVAVMLGGFACRCSARDPLSTIRCFGDLQQLARQRSTQPAPPRTTLPAALADLPYEQYERIAYKPELAIWRESRRTYFETFHRGFVQRDKVRVFAITPAGSAEVPFQKSNFTYGEQLDPTLIDDDAGHAGIKLISMLDGMPGGQELLTFLGASYFRGRSAETRYGTSARALAIDVALNKDEEFPFFHAFWVIQPDSPESKVQVLALLESPSVVGAYRFTFTPDRWESRLDVRSTLHFRRPVEKVALAPLTSMWMWGDGLAGPPKDKRPACHDADGLLIRQANKDGRSEWIWRAFARQSYPSVSRIDVAQLRGFGLLQRNRAFFHFDDHNARYDLRPSVWVTPKETWRDGVIELLELPGAHEGVDNIGAYWVPRNQPQPGTPFNLDYTVGFFAGDHGDQTYVGRATNFSLKRSESNHDVEIAIRFAGTAVAQMSATSGVHVDVETIRATVVKKSAKRTDTGDWIVTVTLRLTEDAPAEISVRLLDAGRALTEQFRYLCPPRTPQFVYPAVYTREE
ncbi:glucan biosynthesis protein [Rhodopirellula sp. JC639]|uniref:glucan biosynthesis protein n=1 Tax=Stieleria mannarensis TaxID=2755585 RepID=UPI0015FFA57E